MSENARVDEVEYETLLLSLEGGVLTLTLNRPDRLNSFTPRMCADLVDAYDRIDADDRVRVVVVTGAGRGFCAGADLSGGGDTFDPAAGRAVGRRSGSTSTDRAPRDGGGLVTLRIYALNKPVIAAFNGAAVGVGVTQTLPMDIRLASEKARFGFVFARRGIVPEAASSWFLPRVVGINKAMEWVATGRIFGADEALAAGLVSEVLAPDALLPRAHALAEEVAAHTSAVSIALSRQMMWRMLGEAHPMAAHRIDSAAVAYMGAGPDAREGVKSFLEKRAPSFSMRVSSDLPEFVPWWDEPGYDD